MGERWVGDIGQHSLGRRGAEGPLNQGAGGKVATGVSD